MGSLSGSEALAANWTSSGAVPAAGIAVGLATGGGLTGGLTVIVESPGPSLAPRP